MVGVKLTACKRCTDVLRIMVLSCAIGMLLSLATKPGSVLDSREERCIVKSFSQQSRYHPANGTYLQETVAPYRIAMSKGKLDGILSLCTLSLLHSLCPINAGYRNPE